MKPESFTKLKIGMLSRFLNPHHEWKRSTKKKLCDLQQIMVTKDYSNLFDLLPVDMLAVRQILVYSTIAWRIPTDSLAEHSTFMYEDNIYYRAATKSTIHRSF